MSELFEQLKGIVDVQKQALMNGVALGRSESEARIKHLESVNAKLLEALKLAVSEFDRIDYKTPWTETEPEWWLAFSTVARYARQAIAEAEGSQETISPTPLEVMREILKEAEG